MGSTEKFDSPFRNVDEIHLRVNHPVAGSNAFRSQCAAHASSTGIRTPDAVHVAEASQGFRVSRHKAKKGATCI